MPWFVLIIFWSPWCTICSCLLPRPSSCFSSPDIFNSNQIQSKHQAHHKFYQRYKNQKSKSPGTCAVHIVHIIIIKIKHLVFVITSSEIHLCQKLRPRNGSRFKISPRKVHQSCAQVLIWIVWILWILWIIFTEYVGDEATI